MHSVSTFYWWHFKNQDWNLLFQRTGFLRYTVGKNVQTIESTAKWLCQMLIRPALGLCNVIKKIRFVGALSGNIMLRLT